MYKVKKEKQRRKDREMSSKSDKLKPQKKPFKKSSGFLKIASSSSLERAQPFLRCQVSSDYSTKVPFYFLKISMKFYLVSLSPPLPSFLYPSSAPVPISMAARARHRSCTPPSRTPSLPSPRQKVQAPNSSPTLDLVRGHSSMRGKREICDDYVPFIPSTRRP